MTRRVGLLVAVMVLVAAATAGALVVTRDRERAAATPPTDPQGDGLTLLVVRTKAGPFAAVIGSTGSADGAVVVPPGTWMTIPGAGEGTVRDAMSLPSRQAATAIANLLGTWVDHYAVLGTGRLAATIDRSGGIPVGEEILDGEEVTELLESAGDGATSAFQLVVGGLLGEEVAWQESDLADSDAPATVLESLAAAGGAPVAALPVSEAANGVVQPDLDALPATLAGVFGGPERPVVGVIVLNGSGVPGVGELVAERLVPEGFRVLVSENASDFDHRETLVVVGSADDVALGERVRDLLGTGSVNVSVASGIAPVTVVVGKDFTG
jgi:hypothetical protein